jgi:hypothetical protein
MPFYMFLNYFSKHSDGLFREIHFSEFYKIHFTRHPLAVNSFSNALDP